LTTLAERIFSFASKTRKQLILLGLTGGAMALAFDSKMLVGRHFVFNCLGF
jgi:hypothetical protein